MVRSRRLELPRVAPQRPQRCASTNSATTARGRSRTTSARGHVANHLGAHKPLVQVRAIFLCSFVEKSGIVMKYRPKKPENRDSIPDSISTGSKKIIRQRV